MGKDQAIRMTDCPQSVMPVKDRTCIKQVPDCCSECLHHQLFECPLHTLPKFLAKQLKEDRERSMKRRATHHMTDCLVAQAGDMIVLYTELPNPPFSFTVDCLIICGLLLECYN